MITKKHKEITNDDLYDFLMEYIASLETNGFYTTDFYKKVMEKFPDLSMGKMYLVFSKFFRKLEDEGYIIRKRMPGKKGFFIIVPPLTKRWAMTYIAAENNVITDEIFYKLYTNLKKKKD